ncbi:putative fatty-acid--CoA ligase [Nocardia nova SH22a]|uniref:Putative fatty-acid--CoA ligase n=1 Tax=Nocardia nova SH22a TaxID=1415166 RepID=W5TMG3_9NOCA|nr:AMP-binding protein [Nocardia nova]AHH18406.1 putative fatty-acid--CoA ligase [Nocardia nova SH22a]
MFPDIVSSTPERPAIVMAGSGATTTFRQLDDRSNQLAQLFRARGIRRGDGVAIFMENHSRFLEVCWAAQRAGLRYTAVNRYLAPEEVAYIVSDSGARAMVTSAALAEVATAIPAPDMAAVDVRLMVDDIAPGWESYEETVAAQPATPVDDECEGDFMLYSSGTTGRPKGIARELTFAPLFSEPNPLGTLFTSLGMTENTVYLCPAPLYHSAPLGWTRGLLRQGATVVVMERFDAETFLATVERYRVTHAQLVPTMFTRLLKLPAEVRDRYDLSSLEAVVHAAAPCPVDVKRAMIDWWGPIVHEYWNSTEGAGFTYVSPAEWLERPGTVGRPVRGALHILDDAGNEVPAGEVGQIWAEGARSFQYHNDAGKTAESTNERGWRTVGDVGYLDSDGYLYLTDRKAFMIISGGVNIYPQEIEDALGLHPKVNDVAVFGVPHEEWGEQVKAVIQPTRWDDRGPELEAELIDYCRSRIAAYKCPRSIDFEPELPRSDTGKLYKRLLRDKYWPVSSGDSRAQR